jgi:hypothetical protein
VGGLDQTRPATLAPVPTTNNRLSLAVDQLPGSATFLLIVVLVQARVAKRRPR